MPWMQRMSRSAGAAQHPLTYTAASTTTTTPIAATAKPSAIAAIAATSVNPTVSMLEWLRQRLFI